METKLNKLIIVISVLFLGAVSSLSEEGKGTASEIDIYLPAKIQLGKGLEDYSREKAETGMQLALSLSRQALLYPGQMMDSVLAHYDESDMPNAFQLAEKVGAHHVLFANLARIEQTLRVNLVSIDLDSLEEGFDLNDALATAAKGEGFAYVNYWQKDGKPMLDPAIITATQRAFANLKADSLLYADAQEPYEVYPWPTLVLGGIKLRDTTGYEIKSELFTHKLISSFAASEAIFEKLGKDGPFVVWDLATRDTLLTYENLYGVENYNLATKAEMSALWKAGANKMILGTLTRIAKGARIDLFLGVLGQGGTFAKEEEISLSFEGDTVEILIEKSKEAAAMLIEKQRVRLEENSEEE